MTKTCALTALSLLALAGTAFADPGDDHGANLPFRAVTGGHPVGFPPARELPELVQNTYDNWTAAFSNPTLTILGQGGVHTLDDLNFDPGPWGSAYSGARIATSMGLIAQFSGTTVPIDCDLVFDFYDGSQLDFTNAAGMITGTRTSRLVFAVRALTPGYIYSYNNINLTGLPAGGVSFAASTGAVDWKFCRPDADPDMTSSYMFTGSSGALPPPGGVNPTSNPAGQPAAAQIVFPGYLGNGAIGSSSASYGRDHSLDGIFTGAAAPGGATQERRQTVVGGATVNMALYFSGDAPPPPAPATAGDFGTLDCNGAGGSTVALNGTLNSVPPVNHGDPALVQVQWFAITLPGDASVAAASYLDLFATDQSGTGTGFITALYDIAGGLVAADAAGTGFLGSGQLTFGDTAPRGNGGGADFDGRNGDLLQSSLGSLQYYIAVTGSGAAFADNFSVNTTNVGASGPYSISARSNLSASGNCALPTPVAPTPTQDLGVLPDAATTTFTGTTGLGKVAWVKFTTDYSVGSADPTQYLDIDTQGSSSVADTQIGLFDSTGVLVGQDDDTGGNGGKSQMSFGDPTRSRTSGGPNAFAGQDGDTLAAGDYYLCAGLFANVFGADGWRARSNSGSNLNTVVNFYTTIPPSGCPADFNGDTVLNADDLGDFITGYFNEPPDVRCDFNGDTVINADDLGDFITAYFNGC